MNLKFKTFYSQFIHSQDLVFDIGANISTGDRVGPFLGLGAKVIAVEPLAEEADKIRNRYPEAIVVQMALGPAEGQATIGISKVSAFSSMSSEWTAAAIKTYGYLHSPKHNWSLTRIVPVTTLDNLIGHYGIPAFCKIDVEGYELEVLGGLSQKIGAVSVEYSPWIMGPTVDCIRRLEELGYREFRSSSGETMMWTESDWIGADEMCAHMKLPIIEFGDVYAR